MSRRLWKSLSHVFRIERSRVVSVLCFHRVLEREDPLRPGDPSETTFKDLIKSLRDRFDMLHVAQIPEYLAGSRSGHGIAVTFDDGYADNFSLAAPALREAGVPATFFVSTGFLDRGCMWNDIVIESVRCLSPGPFSWSEANVGATVLDSDTSKFELAKKILSAIKYRRPRSRIALAEELAGRAGLVDMPQLMMTRSEVKKLDDDPLFEIGAHTVDHPILAKIPDRLAAEQICSGKQELEEIVGHGVDLFAYPNGLPTTDYSSAHVAIVRRAGFSMAMTTSCGGARSGSSPMQLPRQTIWQKNALKACAAVVRDSRFTGMTVDES